MSYNELVDFDEVHYWMSSFILVVNEGEICASRQPTVLQLWL